MKKIYIKKNYNIYNKIKICLKCHNLLNSSNLYPKIINNLKFNYEKIKNFKLFIKYNFNMNFLILNFKNNYILEILKYFSYFPNFKKKFFI